MKDSLYPQGKFNNTNCVWLACLTGQDRIKNLFLMASLSQEINIHLTTASKKHHVFNFTYLPCWRQVFNLPLWPREEMFGGGLPVQDFKGEFIQVKVFFCSFIKHKAVPVFCYHQSSTYFSIRG